MLDSLQNLGVLVPFLLNQSHECHWKTNSKLKMLLACPREFQEICLLKFQQEGVPESKDEIETKKKFFLKKNKVEIKKKKVKKKK